MLILIKIEIKIVRVGVPSSLDAKYFATPAERRRERVNATACKPCRQEQSETNSHCEKYISVLLRMLPSVGV